jgi:DNA-binding CsgD family transcriptional regulator
VTVERAEGGRTTPAPHPVTGVTNRDADPAAGLLGRHAELERLAELLDEDIPVAVMGEAGIGKTAVARAATRASGRPVLEGGGFATLAWAPYLALERAVGRRLVGDPALVARDLAAGIGNAVLFIDDLQWTDPSTRAVVAVLAGRVGLVLAVRTGDLSTGVALDGLPRDVQRVELGPLAGHDVLALARRRRPDLPAVAAGRLVRQTGGNPLLVEELVGSDDDQASLDSVIRRRMGALDPAGREALVMLGLAGRPVHRDALGPGAAILERTGLAFLEPGGRLAVRHELIGAAAAAAVTPATRHRLEAALARSAETPGDAARHYAAAGERALAYRCAVEAADAAALPGERAAHLALAAGMAEGEAADELRLSAAGLLADALEPEAALALVAEVDPVRAGRPDHAVVEARACLVAYRLDEARAAAARGLAALEPGARATIADEVSLRILRAQIAVRALEPGDHALVLAREADALARQHGIETARSLAALGSARYLAGSEAGLGDLETAAEALFAQGDAAAALAAGGQLVFGLLKSGRPAEGRVLAARLATRALDLRLLTWYRAMSIWQAGFDWHTGDFAGAVASTERLEADDIDLEGLQWYRTQALSDLGRHDEARIRAERLLAEAQPGEYDLGECLWLLADVAFAAGRYAVAVEAADRHAREVPDAHHRLFVEVTRAWAVFELGRPPTWPSLEARLRIVEGASIELEALRALASGLPLEAADRFDAAAAAWAGCHARGELRTAWAAAESLRRGGEIAAARDRLLALEPRLEALGAQPMLARVRRSLRLAGVRRAARTGRRAATSLTDRELEILALVARGRRDQEIAAQLGLSRWAVLRAVGSASAKLGAATRAEAVATLATGPGSRLGQ